MATVTIRYIVNDVDAAIAFYCQHLGFHEQMHPAPTFAMLSRGDLCLVLSAPSAQGWGFQEADHLIQCRLGNHRVTHQVNEGCARGAIRRLVEDLRRNSRDGTSPWTQDGGGEHRSGFHIRIDR